MLRRLLVDVGQIGIQSAAGQKLRVQGFSLRLDVPQMPLSLYPDRLFLFGGYSQTGVIIVAPKLVPKTVVLIINVLFHIDILRYNSR